MIGCPLGFFAWLPCLALAALACLPACFPACLPACRAAVRKLNRSDRGVCRPHHHHRHREALLKSVKAMRLDVHLLVGVCALRVRVRVRVRRSSISVVWHGLVSYGMCGMVCVVWYGVVWYRVVYLPRPLLLVAYWIGLMKNCGVRPETSRGSILLHLRACRRYAMPVAM